MSAAWKTIRVFISSTFRDMHAERDHLVRVVFPELRERCAKRHLHLIDVDLRWGVTEEDAQRGKALEICLHEIEDCRPFFIGLLGERYGWIPPRYDIPDEEQFDTLRNIEAGHSITAMEIYHGVLNNPRMRTHAFFYFRDPAFIDTLPLEKQPDFRPEDDEHATKLRQLKDRIRASGLRLRENYRYDVMEALGRRVLEDLWGAVQVEYPEEAPEVEPLDAERAYHDFFIESRTELFIGQRHMLARLHEFAAGDTLGPMVVTGTPGCGKSALLARFVSQFRLLEPETFLIYHFVGASPSSTDPRQMLLRLCRELARRFGFEDEIPEDWNELRVRFWQFCQRAAEAGRVVVVIDALNQLDETYRSHDLDWLPGLLLPGLRLIFSSLDGGTLEAARRKYEQRQNLIVTSLRLVDQGFILTRQLKSARKSLTSARKYRLWRKQQMAQGQPVPPEDDRSQLRYILMGVYSRRYEPTPQQTIQRETANPLYLHLVAEELRLFGSFDRLADFIAALPTDVPGMFQTVLERLEQDHGRELVERALSLVATGRHGLLESELLDLLARPGEQHFPMALWSRLYRSLAFYLKPRASVGGGEEGLIDFFHRQLAKVVHERYLATPSTQRTRHVELAAYFQRKGDPAHDGYWTGNYPRSLSELTHHQIHGQLWDMLEHTLTTLFYLEANVAAGRVFDLAGQFASAVDALAADRPQRRILRLLEEALRRDIHFIAAHVRDYSQGLFQCLWNSCWWYDGPAAAAYYLPSSASGTAAGSEAASLPLPLGETQGVRTRFSPVLPEEGPGGDGNVNRSLAPWQQPGPKLYKLLELWRHEKEEACPAFSWLRALRPPPIHLGTAQRVVLRGHENSVTSVVFSPGGDRIVSGSWDSTVRVWDARSGAQLAVLDAHKDPVSSVAVSPGGDRIVTGFSVDNTVRVWDARSGGELAVLDGHENSVTSVAFSPNGERIVSGSEDHTVRIWDARSGAELAVLRGHDDVVQSVAFSPGGERIVSGSEDQTVRVWDADSGTELAILRGHEVAVHAVAFSPSADRIVSGSDDQTIRVWDADSGAEQAVLRGHDDVVQSVGFSPGGDRIVSGSADQTVRVWDARGGADLATLRGHQSNYDVASVAFSPGGDRIVSGSEDKTVRVWDARSGAELAVLRGHESVVLSVAFSPGGDRIVSASVDSTGRVWDARNGAELAVLRGHESVVSSVAFSPGGDRIVSGSVDSTVRVWDARSGAQLAVLRVNDWGMSSVAFSPGGDRIVSGSEDKTVGVWDARNGHFMEVTDGPVDVGEIAAGPQAFPLRALAQDLKTVVERAETSKPVASFPIELCHIVTHPCGRIWAGAAGSYLCLIALEGGDLRDLQRNEARHLQYE